MDLVRTSSSLFPEVLAAVEQLRQANSSRETRTFARRVANEKIIYEQFARRLALLSPLPSITLGLMFDVEAKIGPEAVSELQRDLELMSEHLRVLKADLLNASRGTEVLAKLGRRLSPLKAPAESSPLQKSLAHVSKTNKRLSAYLLQPLVSLPIERDWTAPLFLTISTDHQIQSATSHFLKVEGRPFSCSCTTSASGFAVPFREETRSPSFDRHSSNQQHHSKNLRIFVQPTHVQSSSPEKPIKLLRNQSADSLHKSVAFFDALASPANHKSNEVSIAVSSVVDIAEGRTLRALIELSGRELEPSERVELAFHVALTTLLAALKVSPFEHLDREFELWTDQVPASGPRPLLLRYHDGTSKSGKSHSDHQAEAMAVLTGSPMLARLGVELTQIMFGRTMAVMRADDLDLTMSTECADPEVRDILTAQRLLTSRRVRHKLGMEFEAILNVCLNQRYREQKLARVVRLDQNDPQFPEHATSLILLPLYQELCKAFGCFCGSLSDRDTTLHETSKQTQSKLAEGSDGKPTSWHELEGQTGKFSGDALIENRTPTVSHQNEQPFSSPEPSGKQIIAAAASPIPLNPEEKSATQPFTSPQSAAVRETSQSTGHFRGQTSPEPRDALVGMVLALNTRGIDTSLGPGSVRSYDTESETTSSWIDWVSDHTEGPPTIADDHPLVGLTPVAISILISRYTIWRACAIEQHQQTGSVPNTSAKGTTSRKRRKRTNEEPDDGPDDDEDNGDEGAGGPSDPSSTSKKRPEKEDAVTLACPFLKKDSTKHGDCSKFRLKRIRDVKQHLARKHQMPMYCPRCIVTFPDEDHRDAHVRNLSCAPSQKGKPEGITERQKRALSRKAPANQSSEDQWYGMWDILFPGHPRPSTPYIDSALLRNAFVYQAFLASIGPGILTSVLETSGAVSWNPPYGTRDVQAWREQVISGAFQQLFDRWAASGAVASPSRGGDDVSVISSSMAADVTGADSPSIIYNTQNQVVDMDSNVTMEMGHNLYRYYVPSSETASSVSGALSWEDSGSDFLGGPAPNGMASPRNGFGAVVPGQYHDNGNAAFSLFETQEMQSAWNRSMSLYGGLNASNSGNNNQQQNNGNGGSNTQRNMQYGH